MYTMGLYKIYTRERGIVTTDIIGSNLRKLTWHREDGPALIGYNDSGSILREIYFINGNSHRLDGPADIWYNEDGTISYEAYCIKGNDYTKEQYYRELLKLKIQSL